MTVIWAWLVGFITEILKKFQGLAQITAFLNIPKGCATTSITTLEADLNHSGPLSATLRPTGWRSWAILAASWSAPGNSSSSVVVVVVVVE